MSLQAPRGSAADLVEVWHRHPVRESSTPFHGAIFDVERDVVDLGAGGVVRREYIGHPGAVVVVALHAIDGVDHVLLIRQYRHASSGDLWELPAGLLDAPDEVPAAAAARELAEEVDLVAGRWDVLTDDIASPGILPEVVRIFLARDLSSVEDGDRHDRTAEERTLRPLWVPLDDAVDAVLAGSISNAAAQLGLLAAHVSRSRDWTTLRPADAAWPAREAIRAAAVNRADRVART